MIWIDHPIENCSIGLDHGVIISTTTLAYGLVVVERKLERLGGWCRGSFLDFYLSKIFGVGIKGWVISVINCFGKGWKRIGTHIRCFGICV